VTEVSIRELRNQGGDVVERAVYTCNPADFNGIEGLEVATVPAPDLR
jgi:hypothetical protein